MKLSNFFCEMDAEAAKNHYYLNFRKEMRMLAILAVVVILCSVSLASTLIGLTIAYILGKITDIGLVLGLSATVGGIVTTCIAYLAPSPLQNAMQRRTDGPPASAQEIGAEVGKGVVDAAKENEGLLVKEGEPAPESQTGNESLDKDIQELTQLADETKANGEAAQDQTQDESELDEFEKKELQN